MIAHMEKHLHHGLYTIDSCHISPEQSGELLHLVVFSTCSSKPSATIRDCMSPYTFQLHRAGIPANLFIITRLDGAGKILTLGFMLTTRHESSSTWHQFLGWCIESGITFSPISSSYFQCCGHALLLYVTSLVALDGVHLKTWVWWQLHNKHVPVLGGQSAVEPLGYDPA